MGSHLYELKCMVLYLVCAEDVLVSLFLQLIFLLCQLLLQRLSALFHPTEQLPIQRSKNRMILAGKPRCDITQPIRVLTQQNASFRPS